MRTAQDLLAERRANVQEQRRETDKTARAMLQFRIDQIDRELHEQRQAIPVVRQTEAMTSAEWSPGQHCRRAM